MIRRTAKFLLEAFGATLAGLALLLGFLAYRLTHEGPIHLKFLVPYLERAVNGPDQDLQVSIDDAILTWAGWQRAVDMRSVNLHVRDRKGRELATIPEASISISARALMRGIIAPSRIEVFGASLRLWRSRDNRLMFGNRQIGGDNSDSQASGTAASGGPAAANPVNGNSGSAAPGNVTPGNASAGNATPSPANPGPATPGAVPPGATAAAPAANDAANDESDNQSAILAKFLGEMTAPPDPRKQTGYLTEVALIGGRVVVVDRTSGASWSADQVQVAVTRDAEGLDGTVSLVSPDLGQPATLTGHLTLRAATQMVEVDTAVTNLDISRVSLVQSGLAFLGGVNMHLNGRLKTEFGLDGKIGPAHFEMSGGPGVVDLQGHTKKPIPVQAVSLIGSLDSGNDLIDIYDLSADINGPSLKISGKVDGILRGTASDGGPAQISLKFAGSKIDAALMDGYWPNGVAENTRAWLVPNIPAGMIDDLQADVHIRLPPDSANKPDVHVTGTMQTSGLTVHYLRPLPPITDGVATASFTEKQFAADIKSGQAGAIKLTGGKVLITGLDQEDQFISVGGDLTSPLRDALVLLDNPRLGYPTKLGLKPQSSSGDATAHLQFDFPAAKNLTFAQVKLSVAAQLANIGLKKAIFGADVTEGNLQLKLTQAGMTVSGPTKLAGIPLDVNWIENFTDNAPFDEQIHAVGTATAEQRATLGYDYRPLADGPAKADLTFTRYADTTATLDAAFDVTQSTLAVDFLKWRKEAGKPGTANLLLQLKGDHAVAVPRFELKTGGDTVTGSLTFKPDGGIDQLNIKNAVYGKSNISDVVAKFAGERIDVVVGGGQLDVEPYMASDDTPKDEATLNREENTPQRPFTLRARNLSLARIAEGRQLTNVTVELSHDPMWWDIIDVGGDLPGGERLSLVYRPAGNGTHSLVAETKDGGGALRALNIYDSVKGGTLKVTGTVKDSEPHRPLRGKLDVTSYRLVKTPFFARLLTVASLTGLVDVLTGEGFFFDGASAKFTKTRGVIDISRFRSAGPSIGLTAAGRLDLDRNQIDVKGTLVPAYAFNSILGNIPLIGNLLQGGEGQGLFAATYHVSGGLAEPKINVNPWAALAPGFLRGLFTGTGDTGDNDPGTSQGPGKNGPDNKQSDK
ncbi:MAG TPA: AsmA-like C-terminal domain-containing protein [Dongiaceae bacterium]|nr:AsmA-like C-terminal domain-containing protein [Dongiaceae bacterium]